MMIAAALICGFLLDLLLGDPAWMPHPVVLMGKCIDGLERILRRLLPRSCGGQLAGGAILAVFMVAITLTITAGVCIAAYAIHPALGFGVQVLWCWQALAARGLKEESVNVYGCLANGKSIDAARRAVSRIVGRNTCGLDRDGVIRAAVETVAENFSDGVLAPLFYLAIGGAPLGMAYKAVNTMDSMIGYKNDKYMYFGRAAARLDDAANYIPSRIAALFLIAAAALTGGNVKNAWRIWRRDSRKHASPNSAQTESVCAGALGIRLAGPAYYFGQLYEKPFIGDSLRPIEAEDILRAVKLMYVAALLSVLLFAAARAAVFFIAHA